jgi:hypothetical protein
MKIFRFLAMCTIAVAFATLSLALAQTYTVIDYPGAVTTVLTGGPNPQGTAVGSYTDTANVAHGFTLTRKDNFKSFDPPGSTGTTPNFITPQGVIVGSYLDSAGTSHGFILKDDKYTTVDFPGAPGTVLTGRNPEGEMTGFWCVQASCANPPFHSFTLSKKGDFTSFDPPGSNNSQASTINAARAVVGAYVDSSGVEHGYIFYNNTFVTNDYPGATLTFDGGNNNQGDIVGEWIDTNKVAHSFLLSNGTYTSFDPPGATLSDATGINPEGTIVGLYVDASNGVHGYVRTP